MNILRSFYEELIDNDSRHGIHVKLYCNYPINTYETDFMDIMHSLVYE